MKILMFGWEFPPHLSGGLGAACQGLTKHLSKLGVDITFVLPRSFDPSFASHMRVVEGQNVHIERGRLAGKKQIEILAVASELRPYQNPAMPPTQHRFMEGVGPTGDSLLDFGKEYSGDLFLDVKRYAEVGGALSTSETFDIIHAHDWMSFPAALEAKRQTGKPLILHIHSTEFDRSGEYPNEGIYQIERQSLHAADKVIAVSHRTEEILVSRYQISPDKIEVVHNAVEKESGAPKKKTVKGLKDKFVLFLGRVTFQKGPEYFVEAARQVLQQM
ncbi:MAG: glycosyltransferase family 4 protein, partial [Spirochaetia bacterium]|nr:glycosyltransferase family 4 protein [Spirochaetia bacterium]